MLQLQVFIFSGSEDSLDEVTVLLEYFTDELAIRRIRCNQSDPALGCELTHDQYSYTNFSHAL